MSGIRIWGPTVVNPAMKERPAKRWKLGVRHSPSQVRVVIVVRIKSSGRSRTMSPRGQRRRMPRP